jgi:ribonuclease D
MSEPFHLQDDLSEEQLSNWSRLPEIAVDTELHGLRLGRDQVLLVQVGDDKGNVALVRTAGRSDCPPRLRRLLEDPSVLKLFHFATSDIAFLRRSLGVHVAPFFCTRAASRLVRTYTQSHGLKDLVREFLGIELDKQMQQTDWSRPDLSPEQLKYAANDVLYLVAVYRRLVAMLEARPPRPTRITPTELARYGTGDGWKLDLFEHV